MLPIQRGLRSLTARISRTPLAAAGVPLRGTHSRFIRSAAACIGKVSGSYLCFLLIDWSSWHHCVLLQIFFLTYSNLIFCCPLLAGTVYVLLPWLLVSLSFNLLLLFLEAF
jgi:hypothetical protein